RSFGVYSQSDVLGTWNLATDVSTGFITFDSTGHISGSSFEGDNGTFSVSGTYAVAASGQITINAITTQNGVSQAHTFTAAMNRSRSAILVNRFGVLISTGNHAPTLTTIAPLATATATHPFDITFDQLLAASNALDRDGDTLQFQVTSLGAGTFTLNGDPAP